MKRSFFALMMLIFVVVLPSRAERTTVRLLAIGNSFSCNSVEQHLHEIAKADSVDLIIGNLYIGACSIDMHVRNIRNDAKAYSYRKIGSDGVMVVTTKYKLSDAIKDESWDYVTVQQVSGLSGILSSYDNLPFLVSWVRQNAPQARVLFHQTWAYAKEATHPDFARYDHDQAKMSAAILQASSQAARQVGIDTIIPCRKAIDLWREHMPETSVTIDGFHLEPRLARYLASATWYATISGHRMLGNSYFPEKVTPEELALAQTIADLAVFGSEPFLKVRLPFSGKNPTNTSAGPKNE